MNELKDDFVKVLDKGYVRLVTQMGSDLTIVNSARVSFSKESAELSTADEKLIGYLAEHQHTSPFRHATLQFEVYAPLMIARQWWKHVIGSDHAMEAWNESSRRYITEEAVFYIPEAGEWREKPLNNKQGSGENLSSAIGGEWTEKLKDYISKGETLYEEAMAQGICGEQARLFLPAYGMYVRWYWTCSLQAAVHFIKLRQDGHAQKEIQDYADVIAFFVERHYPISYKALLK